MGIEDESSPAPAVQQQEQQEQSEEAREEEMEQEHASKTSQNHVSFVDLVDTTTAKSNREGEGNDAAANTDEEQKRKSSKYFVSDPTLKQMFRDAETGILGEHSETSCGDDDDDDDKLAPMPDMNIRASTNTDTITPAGDDAAAKDRKSSMHFITDPALKEMFRDVRDVGDHLDFIHENNDNEQSKNKNSGHNHHHDNDDMDSQDMDQDEDVPPHPRMFDFQEQKTPIRTISDNPTPVWHGNQNSNKKSKQGDGSSSSSGSDSEDGNNGNQDQVVNGKNNDSDNSKETLEQQRTEAEAETERFETDAAEKERIAAVKAEQERMELELQERRQQEWQAAQAAAEKERLEQERLQAEQEAEAARKQAAEAEERERLVAEKEEAKRVAAEKSATKLAADFAARDALENDRQALEVAKQKRIEQEKIAAEAIENERLAAETAKEERIKQEQKANEASEQDRLEQERLVAQKTKQERVAADRMEKERLVQERLVNEATAKEHLVQERLESKVAEQWRLERERMAAGIAERATIERELLDQKRSADRADTKRIPENYQSRSAPGPNTPLKQKPDTYRPSPTKTAATETSTVASLTPPRMHDQSGDAQLKSISSPSRTTADNISNLQRKAGTSPSPPPPSHNVPHPTKSPNEFQQVQLKSTNRNTERYIKETRLEFAEMIANTLKRRTDPSEESNLEALRHIDSLKQELATLPDDDEANLRAINKLRDSLLEMFNRGGAPQEEYLLQWILPLHRHRDPKTGRLVMNADQVALLQSFSTSEELDMVSGLGMVRSILQSNYKAINGTECLQAINDYAHYRLGKKAKRGPRTPWEILAQLFQKAQDEGSSEDIHQRVRNALVQWVVREILGTTADELTSRHCFHAIYLIASLKLELQRLKPASLEHGTQKQLLLEGGHTDGGTEDVSVTSGRSASSRPPVIERLLQSRVLSSDEPPPQAKSTPAASKQEKAMYDGDGSFSTKELFPSGSASNGPKAQQYDLNESTMAIMVPTWTMNSKSDASHKSTQDTVMEEGEEGEQELIPLKRDALKDGVSYKDAINRDEAMREAMVARDSSRKEINSDEDNDKQQKPDESELPLPVQDSHRVLRTILGPNHPTVTVSDCFEAIRIYATLIMAWQEVSKENERLLETQSTNSSPTLEEMRLRSLERGILDQPIEPPTQINIHGTTEMKLPQTKKQKKQKRVDKLESQPEESNDDNTSSGEDVNQQTTGKAAQLDIAAMVAETPPPKDLITAAPKAPQGHYSMRSQKSAEATQAQAKTRKTLMDRLRRLQISGKKKSQTVTGSASPDEDARHPKKRRSRWKKFLGV